jgi:CheY-like chemotaxis protein
VTAPNLRPKARTSSTDDDARWLHVCQAIARLLEVPICGLVLSDIRPYVTEISLTSARDAIVRRKLRRARSTALTIVQTGRAVVVPDLRLTHAFRDTKVPDGVVAFAAAPLDAASGAEALWVADDAPRAWTDRDRGRLEDAAALIGIDLSQLEKGDAELAEPTTDEDLRQELDSTELAAMGRLVGGIAHDFNNLLTAIKGTAQLVLHDLAADDPVRAELTILENAADRATRLTKQLLAVGRGEIPSAPPATPAMPHDTVPMDAAAIDGGPVGTILLVEDDEAVRAFASRALERLGHRVLEATSADAAFELIARTTDPIDLVLADIVMPGMSGRELAVRLSIERPELRLLLMSGHGEEAASLEAQHDTVPFLPKPFSMDRLAASIRKALTNGPLAS